MDEGVGETGAKFLADNIIHQREDGRHESEGAVAGHNQRRVRVLFRGLRSDSEITIAEREVGEEYLADARDQRVQQGGEWPDVGIHLGVVCFPGRQRIGVAEDAVVERGVIERALEHAKFIGGVFHAVAVHFNQQFLARRVHIERAVDVHVVGEEQRHERGEFGVEVRQQGVVHERLEGGAEAHHEVLAFNLALGQVMRGIDVGVECGHAIPGEFGLHRFRAQVRAEEDVLLPVRPGVRIGVAVHRQFGEGREIFFEQHRVRQRAEVAQLVVQQRNQSGHESEGAASLHNGLGNPREIPVAQRDIGGQDLREPGGHGGEEQRKVRANLVVEQLGSVRVPGGQHGRVVKHAVIEAGMVEDDFKHAQFVRGVHQSIARDFDNEILRIGDVHEEGPVEVSRIGFQHGDQRGEFLADFTEQRVAGHLFEGQAEVDEHRRLAFPFALGKAFAFAFSLSFAFPLALALACLSEIGLNERVFVHNIGS